MKLIKIFQLRSLIYPECWSPSERLHKCGMESAEINHRVSGEIKVGNQWSDQVQFGNQEENCGDEKDQHVTAIRFSIFAIRFGEEVKTWIDLVNAKSLNETRN
jgi:hypothetical protein